jgi:glyoxylate reductase
MKPKIFVARAVFPEVLARLEQHFEVESNQDDRIYSADELLAKAHGKVGLFTTPSEPVTAALFAANPQLKAVCNMAVGYNNIDVAAATRLASWPPTRQTCSMRPPLTSAGP